MIFSLIIKKRTILMRLLGCACLYVHASHEAFTNNDLVSFLKPVKFTQPGVRCFFKHTFNQTSYSEHFLPACFLHCLDFLEFGVQLDQPNGFLESSLDIFHQKLKESQWVNPFALHIMLKEFPRLFEPITKNYKEAQKELIKKIIKHALLTRFTELKQDPSGFIDNLADEIMVTTHGSDGEPTVQQLQWCIVRFIESGLNKLIWDPRDQLETWENVKTLGSCLDALYDSAIIPDTKMLNQCYWSLIYRYCYFIESTGPALSLETYSAIQQDLTNASLAFLYLEEQEDFITTKVDRLHKALVEGELKARAHASGIITDYVIVKKKHGGEMALPTTVKSLS
ncbi:MAG: hypothetical protein WC707_06480 [Candidatus Babeliaceae bacterium]